MAFVLYVFLTRILTVFLSTLRVIYIFKEEKFKAFILSFVSILTWFIIVKDILDSNNNIYVYISYALGYGLGTVLGLYYSSKKSKVELLLYIISDVENIVDLVDNSLIYSKIPCIRNEEVQILISLKINSKTVNDFKKRVLDIDNDAYMYTQLLKKSYSLGGVL